MANFTEWLENNRISPVSETARAIAAWNRINDKPASITIYRGGSAQSAQTVRVEFDETGDRDTGLGQPTGAAVRPLVVFGVYGHPTVANTSLAVDDVFVYDGGDYEIKDVMRTLGEIQARAVRRT